MTFEGQVPCKFCGLPTSYLGTQQCQLCWEVDSRLDEFVRSSAGRARVLQALLKHEQQETAA